jgi:hypothetical protein
VKKPILALGAALLIISCTGASGPSRALEGPNILILGEDADEDTVPRNSRVFKRVLDVMSNELHDQGFDVFDETAITMDMAQGRVRRTDAELIDISRSISKPPIDVGVMFSIYASARELAYTTKVKVRVSGRLLSIKSGQRLGNFEVESPREWNAPAKCPRECLLETIGKYSKIIGADVASVLAEKLGDAVGGNRSSDGSTTSASVTNKYSLIFEGFTSDDVLDIEEYLVVFRGYESHRPTYTSRRRAEFWYTSDITTSRLTRNLHKMLDALGVRGRVGFSSYNNEYTVSKISRRKGKPVKGDDW